MNKDKIEPYIRIFKDSTACSFPVRIKKVGDTIHGQCTCISGYTAVTIGRSIKECRDKIKEELARIVKIHIYSNKDIELSTCEDPNHVINVEVSNGNPEVY